ncbi:MAG: HNH endonuclease signature motif containing protein [Paracoccus sp. (in: a-proteobacteria)]|uniref:HNH endonuclease signature motif containing protein n=1 Tax=Paracoccus sp. TaxID=267 RepID=UPI0026DF20CD|nr:HNH endonuclease signature motif containing protein [Paracoccus sp. (in: a-proteobacteria)]MDO5621929.1 HNH endonuclease signature motif containing protein [Paracoccus sp. (in: a-proteobacteria)]
MSRHPFYKTARWRRSRLAHLAAEPVCRLCRQRGLVNDGGLTLAGAVQPDRRRRFLVVDHIVPHRGDVDLFWDRANWQTLCPDHHDIVKQREEVRGFSNARAADGWPVDPAHPANR